MKIYILADMEGVSGIRKIEQVQTDSGGEYAEGRRLMVADVNACIDALFEAGVSEVVACDTHGGGGQFEIEKMDPRAVYETPGGGRMMPALDASFDGVILFGHHARAGTVNGFLDHTMSSAAWFGYWINGVEVGEIGIEASWAGHYDVPVIMVSGDEMTAKEARELLDPDLPCAVVKWGLGRNRARCLSLDRAHAVVRQTVQEAVSRIGKRKPYKPALPATLQLTQYRSDMIDGIAARPEVERVDARTVRKQVGSLLDVSRW